MNQPVGGPPTAGSHASKVTPAIPGAPYSPSLQPNCRTSSAFQKAPNYPQRTGHSPGDPEKEKLGECSGLKVPPASRERRSYRSQIWRERVGLSPLCLACNPVGFYKRKRLGLQCIRTSLAGRQDARCASGDGPARPCDFENDHVLVEQCRVAQIGIIRAASPFRRGISEWNMSDRPNSGVSWGHSRNRKGRTARNTVRRGAML